MVLMRARVNNDAVLQPLSATSQRAESRSHRRRGWNARNVDDFNCDPLPVSSLRIFLIFHDPPNLAASFFFSSYSVCFSLSRTRGGQLCCIAERTLIFAFFH